VTETGNFEHNTNVMSRNAEAWNALRDDPKGGEVRSALDVLNRKILAERASRIRPLTDDKVVTAWNGMALKAFSRGYQVTGEQRFLDAAQKLGTFLAERMYANGELLHTYRAGVFSRGPLLEDYGYVADGMIDLYESDGDFSWLDFAGALVDDGFEKFSDEQGFLYLSVSGASDLIVRPSDVYDGSYPSPGAYLLSAGQRVSALMDDRELDARVGKSLSALASSMQRSASGMMSTALVHHNNLLTRLEFAIVGVAEKRSEFLNEIYQRYLPYRIIASAETEDDRIALLRKRSPLSDNGATGFVCENYTCQLPTDDLSEFKSQIDKLMEKK
jgi:uncharacterized protein YyaL (SSP411 family)